MSRNAQIVLIVVVGLGGLMVLACVGVAGIIIWKMQSVLQPPEDIRVAVESPSEVNVGESFSITVRVSNDAAELQVIDSIDVYDTYLRGVALVNSEPRWHESSNLGDFVTYGYGLTIPAGGSQVVTFQAKAIRAGDFMGDFDVCINHEASFQTQVVRTLVSSGSAKAEPRSADARQR